MITTDLAAAVDAIAAALNDRQPRWALRPESPADRAFVDALYASTRWEELSVLPWPDEAKRAFLHDQSRVQGEHYRQHYPGAALHLLEHDGAAVGRIYLHVMPGEFRLMDIALLPQWRGQGHGGRVLRALQQVATAQRRRISLHVEPNNPAQRLYARLGFERGEQRGVYQYLSWLPPVLS